MSWRMTDELRQAIEDIRAHALADGGIAAEMSNDLVTQVHRLGCEVIVVLETENARWIFSNIPKGPRLTQRLKDAAANRRSKRR